MKKFIDRYNNQLLAATAIFVFVILFIYFYPSMYTIQDEADYFDFAYKLKEGTIYFDRLYAHKVVFNGKGYVDMYPPGMPALLLPFTFVHWKTLFLLNPLLHIAAFLSFFATLKFLKINTRLSALYLFFPAFTLYTRTLTADMTAASLFMIALYFYFKKGSKGLILSGILLGIICMIKYANFILAAVIMLFLLLEERRKIIYIIIGFLPFVFLILAYNHVAYGGIFKTGYTYIAAGAAFKHKYLFANLPFYALALTVIYPLMFPSIFFYRKAQKREIIIISLLIIAFFSFWHYVQAYPGDNLFAKLTVGMRLILPVVPLFLLAYADLADRILKKTKNYYSKIVNLTVVLLVIVAFAVSFKHQQYTDRLFMYREKIYSNIPDNSIIICDWETTKFLQNAWRRIGHIGFYDGRIGTLLKEHGEVYVVALVRFDKEAESKRKLRALEYIDKRYNLEPVCELKDYFNLRIYKIRI